MKKYAVKGVKMIDVSLISKEEGRIIGLHWYEMLERFYSNPEIEEKFQAWVRNKQDIKISHDTRRL